jgi:dTDP-4-amino-4,6-dideoxygalactose transaminase
VSDCLLRLPLYYEMTQDDVHYVTENVKKLYKKL